MMLFFFFLSVGGTYFPFTVLLSHMDSMDLIYTSMFVNTGQKRASSFCPRNFPLPLPKHKAGDKSKLRERDGGSEAPGTNHVALLTPNKAGDDVLLPWSGQVKSIQICRQGKKEESYLINLWRGLIYTPTSQDLIWWANIWERQYG